MTVLEVVAIVLFVAYVLFWIIHLIVDSGIKGALITLGEYAFIPLVLYSILFVVYGWYVVALILAICAFLIYYRISDS